MKCIFCLHPESKVLDSRSVDEGMTIRRRRECLKCAKRFTTFEVVETSPVLIVKSDGTRQAFDSNKIKAGVIKACEKRPVSIEQIDGLAQAISKRVQNSMEQEMQASEIGEYVMEELRKLDEVAYVRFASVYRRFTDISTFIEFINEKTKKI